MHYKPGDIIIDMTCTVRTKKLSPNSYAPISTSVTLSFSSKVLLPKDPHCPLSHSFVSRGTTTKDSISAISRCPHTLYLVTGEGKEGRN